MGTGRTLRAVMIPFVRQHLRPFFKPREGDLVVLKELLKSWQDHPGHRPNLPFSETPEAIRYIGERSTHGNRHHRLRASRRSDYDPVRNAPGLDPASCLPLGLDDAGVGSAKLVQTVGRRTTMGKVRTELAVSLDGFISGPNNGTEAPMGHGGERLLAWYAGGDTEYRLPGTDMVFQGLGADRRVPP
jgi:hypothetical protein